ncbi:DUF7933 domain-containing protein [Ramlibacter sp. PS4R-6]|uniref:DUF7933 domain-containing protein n=1 Tax=Ramlibacter sp. PS4R-6 TaxID=3133438 RepID=UPI0030B089DC
MGRRTLLAIAAFFAASHAAAQDISRGVTLSFPRDDGEVTLYLWARAGGYTFAADLRPAGQAEPRSLADPADIAPEEAAALARDAGARAATRVHAELVASLHVEPASVAVGAPSILTMAFASAGGATLVRPLTLQLPPGVTLAAQPALGGTCAAMVRAAPGGNQVTLERGSVIRRGGCDVSARVVARSAGVFLLTLAAGSVLSDAGTNSQFAGATLSAAP